jgi:ATP-dependent DNA helicase 2 subunit 2
MADKQATVYIVDQGKSMGEKRNGRDETDLEYGMRYIWGKITETLLANRVTFTVGVVGLRTDNTDNPLQGEDSYENISVLQPICAMKMGHLKELQECIKVNETEAGDAFSAIIVAVDMISQFTKKLKYIRKIVLVTNARGPMDDDESEELVKKMNGDNIQLVVV